MANRSRGDDGEPASASLALDAIAVSQRGGERFAVGSAMIRDNAYQPASAPDAGEYQNVILDTKSLTWDLTAEGAWPTNMSHCRRHSVGRL